MHIRLLHRSSIPGTRWFEPIGWTPTNEIEGAEFIDGAWWSEEEEEAELIWYGEGQEGDEIDANPDDLRLASGWDGRVLGPVKV